MIRTALLLCAGLLAALCFACVQTPTIRSKLLDCPAETGPAFANRVYELAVTTPLFSAAQYANCDALGSCPSPPPQRGNPSAYASVIKGAFDLAPVFFQNQLCSLDTVYIVTDPGLQSSNPRVWGMRERAHNLRKHVAISSTILGDPNIQAGNSPYAYWETQFLYSLLGQSVAGLQYISTDQREYTAILDILAHEMGHIIWWDQDVVHRKDAGGYYFDSFSWRNANRPVTPRFHQFGAQVTNDRPVGPSFKKIITDLSLPGSGSNPNTVNDLLKVYDQQSVGGTAYSEWPSMIATISTDEDFVETFKMWVLTYDDATTPTTTALTSSKVQIPTVGQPIDMIQHFQNNAVLTYKRIWIVNNLTWQY